MYTYLQISLLYIYKDTYCVPLFLATAKSQCLMTIARDGGLSTLCRMYLLLLFIINFFYIGNHINIPYKIFILQKQY